MKGKENFRLNLTSVKKELNIVWPGYQKPADARTLASKFSLDDLFRVAAIDEDVKELLTVIGHEQKLEKYK